MVSALLLDQTKQSLEYLVKMKRELFFVLLVLIGQDIRHGFHLFVLFADCALVHKLIIAASTIQLVPS